MAGKLHNEAVLTPAYLMTAVAQGKSTADIERDTGINRRVISRRLDRLDILHGGRARDERRLGKLIDEAHAKADELQVLYLRIEKIKDRMGKRSEDDMVKITNLARELKKRRHG